MKIVITVDMSAANVASLKSTMRSALTAEEAAEARAVLVALAVAVTEAEVSAVVAQDLDSEKCANAMVYFRKRRYRCCAFP